MLDFTKNCFKFFKIYAGAQLEPVFGGFETRLKFIKSRRWIFMRSKIQYLQVTQTLIFCYFLQD